MNIPHIIHQVWIDFGKAPMPYDDYLKKSQILCNLHSDWTYYLWFEKDILWLIENYFPWFLSTWQSFWVPIQKCDAARYVILYAYGGVYIDMDIKYDKPFLNELFKRYSNCDLMFGSQFLPAGTLACWWISNYFMASKIRHPFWLQTLQYICNTVCLLNDKQYQQQQQRVDKGVPRSTGTLMLRKQFKLHQYHKKISKKLSDHQKKVVVLDPHIFSTGIYDELFLKEKRFIPGKTLAIHEGNFDWLFNDRLRQFVKKYKRYFSLGIIVFMLTLFGVLIYGLTRIKDKQINKRKKIM